MPAVPFLYGASVSDCERRFCILRTRRPTNGRGKGCRRDNVFVELLWKSIKYEDVYWRAYETVGAGHSTVDIFASARLHPAKSNSRPTNPNLLFLALGRPLLESFFHERAYVASFHNYHMRWFSVFRYRCGYGIRKTGRRSPCTGTVLLYSPLTTGAA